MVILTSQLIENAACPPGKKQLILRCGQLKGFGLRVTDKGSKAYVVEHRINGSMTRITIAKVGSITLDPARDQAKSIIKEMKAGQHPKQQEPVITLGEILEEYLRIRQLRPASLRSYRNVTKQRLGDWLSLPVTDITKQMIMQRHWDISNVSGQWKASKVQANNSMMILKALLNYAANQYSSKNGQPLIAINPVTALSKNRSWHRIPPRQGIIADHQLEKRYQAVAALRSATVRDLLLLVLFTGLRRTQAMTLSWSDIDFESKVLTVRAGITKNHKEHRLPLSTFLYDLLRRRKEASKSEWVFPGRGGHLVQCSEVLDQVRVAAGIKFSLHDLRRSFLTLAERVSVRSRTW